MPKITLSFLLCLLSASALADSGIRRVPCGYQQITSLSAAAFLTVPASCGGPVTMVVLTPEAQAVRYRDDAIAPTASVGQPLAVGATIEYQGSLSKIRFIEQTSGAKLNASYYR